MRAGRRAINEPSRAAGPSVRRVLPGLRGPEEFLAGRRQQGGNEGDACEQHDGDRDRDRGAEDAELPEVGKPEGGEGNHDRQPRRGDDLGYARRRLPSCFLSLLTEAQPLAEAKDHEQEVVDPDSDQHHLDQVGNPGIEVIAERERAQHDDTCRRLCDDQHEQQRQHRREHTPEEEQGQQEDRPEEQILPQSSPMLGGVGDVGLRRDPTGEADSQVVAGEGAHGLRAELLERLHRRRVGRVALELERDQFVASGAGDAEHTRVERVHVLFATGEAATEEAPTAVPERLDVDAPRRETCDERFDRALVGGSQRPMIGALDETGDGRCALDLTEVRFAELDCLY